MTDYEWYKSIGICVQCRKEKAAPHHVRCEVCLEQNLSTQESRRRVGTYRRADRRSYNKTLRERRKAAGLCIDCGRPICSSSKCYCVECRIKNQKRNERRKEGLNRSERKQYGLCYICGKEALPGKAVCKEHYDTLVRNLEIAGNSDKTIERRNQIRKQNRLIFNN